MVRPSRSIAATVQERSLLWLLPAVLFLGLLYLYPLIDVVRLSFTDASLVDDTFTYSLRSYQRILNDPQFLQSFIATVIFTAASVILKLVIGMVLALAIDAGVRRRLAGTIIMRTSVLAAWVIPGVIVGILWNMLLSSSSFGIVNYLLLSFLGVEVPFLFDPNYSLASVILANVWRGTAFTMILFYAGLQRIPPELYEAAVVDGASALQKFRFVTLPMLSPVIFIALVLITISSFNAFDLILALTNGGPMRATEVLSISAYRQVFSYLNLGRGAAIAVVLLVINLTMTLIYIRITRVDRNVH